MKSTFIAVLTALTTVCFSCLSLAGDYKTDIGYTALQRELGSATPTGAGVRVTQVEAPTNDVSGGAPLPAGEWLFGSGLAGVVGFARRRMSGEVGGKA